jgi:hypothetical protein
LNNHLERGNCRFIVSTTPDGKPGLRVELFHDSVPTLARRTVGFELLRGTSVEDARKLAELMNERILGVVIAAEP